MKNEVQKLFKFFKVLENLALERRAIQLSDGTLESTAEHCFSTAMLVITLKPYIENKLDYTKALEMALIHDLGESITGDIGLHDQNKNIKQDKYIKEKEAVYSMTELLHEQASNNIKKLWEEYEARKSNEAKLIKLLDVFDAMISVVNHPDFTYAGEYGDGQFYYNYYANLSPNKGLKVDGEIFEIIETTIRESMIKKMDDKGIKYNLK